MSKQSSAGHVSANKSETVSSTDGNKDGGFTESVWWLPAGHERKENSVCACVCVCVVCICNENFDTSNSNYSMSHLGRLLDVFSSFNGLLISAHPHSRVKFWQVWHVYPSHSAETSAVSWSYLYHFTSSFSIFSVARRDWSCWNLKMSSPFSGGCTEIWHSWRKIREMHNQGGEIKCDWMMDTGIKILMHLHSRLQRLCQQNAARCPITASKQGSYHCLQHQQVTRTQHKSFLQAAGGELAHKLSNSDHHKTRSEI